MNKISSFIYIGLLALSGVSCNQPVPLNNYDSKTQITIRIPDIKCVHSDSIIKEVKFVALEVNDTCLIKRVQDIKLNDSLIFINDDRYRLLVFDLSGKYLYQIGQRGNGPDEYLEIKDFLINHDTIEVLDFQKIEYYTLDGKHLQRKRFSLSKEKGEYNPRFFTKLANNGYCFWEKKLNNLKNKDKIPYYMYQVDSNFHIVQHHFPAMHRVNTNIRKFIPYSHHIIIDPMFADPRIYQIDSIGQVSVRYLLDFEEKGILPEDLLDLSTEQILEKESKHILQCRDFAETNHWVHLTFYWEKVAHNLFYDKLRKKTFLLSSGKKYERDDDMRFWYVQTTYKDQLVFGIDPAWFMGERERLNPEYREKYHLNDEGLQDINEDSNFIIAFYTLK